MTINEIKVKQFAEQIREDVELADAFGDEWVHVRCLKCHLERRHFTNEYVEKLAADAVKNEIEIDRLSKMVEAIKSTQPISDEDKKWWKEFCKQ